MMNMFFPIEDYYMSYDSPYERRRKEQLRRRGEAEAALRHSAEMEYYQQMQHEERERRRQGVMRRRQQEEHVRWKQREMQRRNEEELRIHEKRLRQQEAGEPQWDVRGPDGRLYRVALDPRNFEAAEKDKPRSHRKQKQKKTKPVTNNLSSTEEPDDRVGASKVQKAMLTKQNSVKEIKPRRKRVTIIVEDASDSEMEDEPTSSSWRKRSPSPGQWMEPVDFA